MTKIQNFHENIEHDFARLTAEIQAQKNKEHAPVLEEREIVKRSLEAVSATVVAPPEGAVSTKVSPTQEQSHLPAYVAAADDSRIQQEIERLVTMVFQEGLENGLRESKKHPPFVQDAFHAALVDKLLPELQKRGIIQ